MAELTLSCGLWQFNLLPNTWWQQTKSSVNQWAMTEFTDKVTEVVWQQKVKYVYQGEQETETNFNNGNGTGRAANDDSSKIGSPMLIFLRMKRNPLKKFIYMNQ